MKQSTKMVLAGMPVRYLCEGVFSEIQIELTNQLEDLENKVKNAGDFEFGNTLNPAYQNIKAEFDNLVSDLDNYDLNVAQFVSDTFKHTPTVTFLELLALIRDKFL